MRKLQVISVRARAVLSLLVVAAALGIGLGACGRSGGNGSQAATQTATPAPTARPTKARASARANTAAVTTTTQAAQSNLAYDTNAAASYAVGPQPANWDIHSAGASPWHFTLEQVLAQVWPSAFEVGTNGAASLNTSLLSSATEVSSDPETVVYRINPLAVWSNGVPITYKDFAYNWQAQSGKTAFRDVGGARYTPLDTAGYDDISAVTGSPTNPRTVRVTFSSPYPDWQSLFSYLMPAQTGRAVGFDSGFKDPVADLVSGGPYLVSVLQDGYSLELVRNARYWGSPAALSAITYYFTDGDAETEDALNAGQVDLATLQPDPAAFKQLQADPGLSVRAVASNLYEDLDMNEASTALADPILRRAIMMSLDRGSMVSQLLTPYGISATPVEDRIFLPGNQSYQDDGADYDKPAPAAAIRLLSANGYTLTAGTLHNPAGQPVSLSLAVEGTDAAAQQLATDVVRSAKAIGITLNVVQTGAGAGDPLEAATPAPLPAGWQLALELRQVPAFPSAIASRYATGGSANQDGYSNATMNSLLRQIATAPAAKLGALYTEIDDLAWKGYVDLPLVQLPVVVAVNSKLQNVDVGAFFGNIAANEEDWGFLSS